MKNTLDGKGILSNIDIMQISSGFLLGLSVGYFLKKSFKLLLFFAGLATVVLFWFNSQHNLEIDNNSLLSYFDHFLNGLKSSYSFIYEKLSNLELIGGASIIAGFMLGLKIG